MASQWTLLLKIALMSHALHVAHQPTCTFAMTCSAKRATLCSTGMQALHVRVQCPRRGKYLAQPFWSKVAAGGLKGDCQPCHGVLVQPRDCLGQLGCHPQLGHCLHSPAAPLAEPQCVGVFPILLSIPAWPGATFCLHCLSVDRRCSAPNICQGQEPSFTLIASSHDKENLMYFGL